MDFARLAYLAIIIVGIVVAYIKRGTLNSSSQRLGLLLFGVLIFEILAYVCRLLINNNLAVYHVAIPAYLILYCWVFSSEINLFVPLKYIVISIVVLCTVSGIFHQPINTEFPSTVYLVSGVAIIVLCLIYLRKLLNVKEVVQLTNYPLFIVSFALMFFYTINLFGFGAFKFVYFRSNESLAYFFTILRQISNYLLYTAYIFAFLSKQAGLNK